MAPPNAADFAVVLRRASQARARGDDAGDAHVVEFCGLLAEGGPSSAPAALDALAPFVASDSASDACLGLSTLHECVGNFVPLPAWLDRDPNAADRLRRGKEPERPFHDALERLAAPEWIARFRAVAARHADDPRTFSALRDCLEDFARRAAEARERATFERVARETVSLGATASGREESGSAAASGVFDVAHPGGVRMHRPPALARSDSGGLSGLLPPGMAEMSGLRSPTTPSPTASFRGAEPEADAAARAEAAAINEAIEASRAEEAARMRREDRAARESLGILR